MVGWHLLLLLVVEVIVYGALGRHVHVAHGWGVTAALVLAVGIYLGIRIVLVGVEFILARWKGSPIPETLRVSGPKLARMYVRELGGWIWLFTFVMPFVLTRRSVIDRPTMAAATVPPILLVHGLACNRGNGFWLRRQLERLGYRVFATDYTPPVARISRYAPQLGKAIDEIVEATGAPKLILIAHSQGGLVARDYLDRYGTGKVVHVITLGSPHQGTWLTRLGVGPNVADMREDGAWLADLRQREAARGAAPYSAFTCIVSYHDNLVFPQLNAVLPGSTAIALSGVGHVSLVFSMRVVRHIAQVLARIAA